MNSSKISNLGRRKELGLLLILFLICPFLQAQQSMQQLNRYMAELRSDSYPTVPKEILQDKENALALLQAIAPYTTDSLERVRRTAFNLSRRLGKGHPAPEVRKQAVETLVLGLQDVASPVVGVAVSGLRYFNPEDFSEASRASLLASFTPAVPHKGSIAKLLGYMQMEEAKPALISLLREGGLGRSDQWAAYLALARMRDEEVLDFVLGKVSSLPLNDDVIYDILPDLLYIRQPESIAYLVEVLYSEEKKCQAADAELGGAILCGYRVMEMLAPVIKDFPLKQEAGGDLAVNDYEAALLEVRAWFRANPDYEILSDAY
jgi:hypothetical protein